MIGIEKSFPGVRAIKHGRLELLPGEVHALLGENGAGKSTLIKILAGAHRPDAGTIRIDGRPEEIHSPLDAQRLGIAVVYQEFNLVPALTARENIFLGREKTRGGFTSPGTERREAEALFRRINIQIDPETPCRDLTVAQQQCVEIAKALSQNARIIVLDEPSAVLTDREVEKLFAIIRDLQSHGIGIIYISHRLDEIFAIADRATVMRDGEYIDTQPVAQLTRERIIELMVGRKLDQEFPKQRAALGAERLVVRNLQRSDKVKDVSFHVHAGEVLALTGLVGAGRTETVRLIFGADQPDSGSIELDGKLLHLRGPRDAIRAGIGLLTEDRKAQGLVLGLSVRENFGLPNLPAFTSGGFVQHQRERDAFAGYVETLRIKISDHDQLAKNLSGGNQQKVVLAKWLERHCDVIIFDEPTRGIDVGAKYEIYLLINQLAAQGKAILMISSELPEVLGMADRILVMHEGRITGEITDVPAATQQDILKLAMN
ncbi:MAG: sugar ABC transporter ATP-binding protein [Verrucomicrobia bacterium]|nr:sugar ABC transporter ATP-binding protein [Verrucomicrobiota bacterium]